MLRKIAATTLLAATVLLFSGADSLGQTQTRVRFRKGSVTARVSGKLTGFAKRTFVVRAKEAQDLTAELTSENTGVRFGDLSTSLNYTTKAGDNYVFIKNDGRAATTFTLIITIR